MSINLTDYKRENVPLTQLRRMQQNLERQKTIQIQGTEATRLAVVEGFIWVSANAFIQPENTFIDIEAPSNATILTGSLVYSTFFRAGPFGPGSPTNIQNWGASNDEWVGVYADLWLPYAKTIETPESLDSPESVQHFRVEDNKIRIGARVIWRLAMLPSPTLGFYFPFQLRMTLGWSGESS